MPGSCAIALDRYLRGQDKALSVVGVPTEDQEQKRALIRYHRQIMADRGRCEARGKGLAVCSRHRSPWPMVATLQGVARSPERSSAQGLDKGTADWVAKQNIEH